MTAGRCWDTGADFFADHPYQVAACLQLCAQCEVRVQCLTYALDNDITDGIWGGVRGRGLYNIKDYLRRGRQVKQLDPSWKPKVWGLDRD